LTVQGKAMSDLPAPAYYANPQDLLSVKQLAERLHVKPSWVYSQTKRSSRSGFPFIQSEKTLFFSWAGVCQWLQERERK